MSWPKISIQTSRGPQEAIAPSLLSVSRATDIPAFHTSWFMNRLRQGYVRWVNPYSGRDQYVSFARARALVFWSKNPEPLLPHLEELDRRGIASLFQFTLMTTRRRVSSPGCPLWSGASIFSGA